jgi:hypothetical protein
MIDVFATESSEGWELTLAEALAIWVGLVCATSSSQSTHAYTYPSITSIAHKAL